MRTSSKREQILEAAVRVLTRQGLEKTRISDIVREAGVAQGTFYLYFPSKHALIPAIAAGVRSRMLLALRQEVPAGGSLQEILEALVDGTIRITGELRDELVLCYLGLALSGGLQSWEEARFTYCDWLAGVLEPCRQRGEIHPDTDLMIAAGMVKELVESVAERIQLYGGEQGLSRSSRRELLVFLMRALGGPECAQLC